MEKSQNYVELWGTAGAAPSFSHENHGESFYRFPLRVERLSGQSDLPLILAPSALLEGIDIAEGTPLRVTGQLRSFNNRSGHGSRLVISTFAQSIEPCDGGHFNRILLSGVLCKQPTLRRTPLGRSICDMILAVNRRYGRADYLPCIAWGKVAAKIAEMQVGDRLTLEGRVQSRTYIKQTDAGSEERTAYEVSVMQLLDEMARLLGSQGITVPEYEDLFSLLLRSSDLGHIPQTLDAVVLASAGKMRLDAPDYVFVLGLAEGEFPCTPAESGLLTHADRDALMAQEIDLPDCFENRVVREQVCFYKALTAPAKGLWLSWPKGQGQTLCAALEPLVEALAPAAPELELTDLAATPADGLDCLGGGWPLTEAERASLTEALHTPGETEPQGLALLRRMADTAPRQVHDLPALEALLGRKLRISPSQLEKYYTCRYGYFLQYVLGLKPRRRAELSADQSGTLMHWVLQMALDPHPGPDNPMAALQPFMELDDEAMASLAALLVDEYAKRYLPEDTARFAYLLSRLKKSMTSLLLYLRDEQRQSSFKPVACELKIGRGEDAVPAQVYHLSDGRTVQLVGTVDRADEWVEEDGTRWVRVVDYKTGTKKLDLKEVYCGLDCQMLLYLFSLTRDAGGRFTGAQPAGVLYLLADPAPQTLPRGQAARAVEYQLDGLVRDEQKIFDAMDADETGKYLPFGYRNGAPSPYQKDKRADSAKLSRIQLHLDDLVTQMGEQLYGGQIDAEPLVVSSSKSPCTWCDYSFICCHETGVHERALEAPAKPFEPEEEPEEEEEQP